MNNKLIFCLCELCILTSHRRDYLQLATVALLLLNFTWLTVVVFQMHVQSVLYAACCRNVTMNHKLKPLLCVSLLQLQPLAVSSESRGSVRHRCSQSFISNRYVLHFSLWICQLYDVNIKRKRNKRRPFTGGCVGWSFIRKSFFFHLIKHSNGGLQSSIFPVCLQIFKRNEMKYNIFISVLRCSCISLPVGGGVVVLQFSHDYVHDLRFENFPGFV